MADKEDYLRLHLHDYRKENGYVFYFFEGDLKEFLEGFRWLKMCFYIKDRLFLESVAFVYNRLGTQSQSQRYRP